jgi:hypothetical protein
MAFMLVKDFVTLHHIPELWHTLLDGHIDIAGQAIGFNQDPNTCALYLSSTTIEVERPALQELRQQGPYLMLHPCRPSPIHSSKPRFSEVMLVCAIFKQ